MLISVIQFLVLLFFVNFAVILYEITEKDVVLPQCVVIKMSRILSTKRREFMKLRKSLISQQVCKSTSYR